jgi:hypothetical protein
MEDDLKKKMKKNGDDMKKNKILIPLQLRGKPFLGLAQLSKIFYMFYDMTSFPPSGINNMQ